MAGTNTVTTTAMITTMIMNIIMTMNRGMIILTHMDMHTS